MWLPHPVNAPLKHVEIPINESINIPRHNWVTINQMFNKWKWKKNIFFIFRARDVREIKLALNQSTSPSKMANQKFIARTGAGSNTINIFYWILFILRNTIVVEPGRRGSETSGDVFVCMDGDGVQKMDNSIYEFSWEYDMNASNSCDIYRRLSLRCCRVGWFHIFQQRYQFDFVLSGETCHLDWLNNNNCGTAGIINMTMVLCGIWTTV